VGVHGLIVPNRFAVTVSPGDRERFASFEEALLRELADAVRSHAREEGYGFLGQVEVTLETDDNLREGQFTTRAETVADPGGRVGTLVTPEGRRVPVGDSPVVICRPATSPWATPRSPAVTPRCAGTTKASPSTTWAPPTAPRSTAPP
jgi:hypothetical protein